MEVVIYGIINSVILSLYALGFTLVYSISRLPNFAHGALYVTFYYVGASLGSALPGYAWQAWGWPGVAAACVTALAVGLVADGLLCG